MCCRFPARIIPAQLPKLADKNCSVGRRDMANIILVSLAVMAGVIALVGVPLRAWQFATGRFRPHIPPFALARKTFAFFAVLFLTPNVLAWAYVLYVAYRDLNCTGACAQAGTSTAIALGMLGCAYVLLEGFLLTARRRKAAGDPGSERENR